MMKFDDVQVGECMIVGEDEVNTHTAVGWRLIGLWHEKDYEKNPIERRCPGGPRCRHGHSQIGSCYVMESDVENVEVTNTRYLLVKPSVKIQSLHDEIARAQDSEQAAYEAERASLGSAVKLQAEVDKLTLQVENLNRDHDIIKKAFSTRIEEQQATINDLEKIIKKHVKTAKTVRAHFGSKAYEEALCDKN